MPLGKKNPFYPDVERVPLRLMLDARSFEPLTGELQERAGFLCELCWTDAIDALWSWEGQPIEETIPRTELRPLRNNDRAVGRCDEPPDAFIGGVASWDQFDRWANQNGYEGEEREWFIYYGALAHFSDRSGRHFLVTADSRLLKESEGDQGWFRKGRHRIISIGHALFLAGLAMKAHREVFYDSPQPGHTIYTFSHSMYEWLAMDLVRSPRLFDLMKQPGEEPQDFFYSEREALAESLFDRVADILRARDRVALTNARHQDDGTLNEMRYDLSSMIGSAAAIFDTIAVLAHIAFPFQLHPGAGDAAISLRRSDFRKGLRGAGARGLADAASQLAPFLKFVWGLRNPLLHRQGLPGYNLHVLGAEREPQITLSEKQVELLRELCGQRGETTEQWGLNDRKGKGIPPSVNPMPFGHCLSLVTIKAVDRLVAAFAIDRGVADEVAAWTTEQQKMLQRFRWLSGIPDEAAMPA